jgi:hypothetical protein
MPRSFSRSCVNSRSYRCLPALESIEPRRLLTAINVVTGAYNLQRNGDNTSETTLSASNVNPSDFGKLHTLATDGAVVAQPLELHEVFIGKQIKANEHDMAIVATTNDSVYAYDVNSGALLWKRSLLNSDQTSIPGSAVAGLTDLTANVGINATPVIDAHTGTIYVVSSVKVTKGSTVTYADYLYALNDVTGQNVVAPVKIAATVAGTGFGSVDGNVSFNAHQNVARSALTELNGVIYIAFDDDLGASGGHGWLLGYNATTLAQTNAFCTTPDGSGGGIWMGGEGPSNDPNNGFPANLYFTTEDGTFDNSTDFGSTLISYDPADGGSIFNYHTPGDTSADTGSLSIGTGDFLVFAPHLGETNPYEGAMSGGYGTNFLFDDTDLGQFVSGGDNDVLDGITPFPSVIGGPAEQNDDLFYVATNSATNAPLTEWALGNDGWVQYTPIAQSTGTYVNPGATPVISSNGGGAAGVVWFITKDSKGRAELGAYDFSNPTSAIYSSGEDSKRDEPAGSWVPLSVPTVANGHVLVGTSDSVVVYGELT